MLNSSEASLTFALPLTFAAGAEKPLAKAGEI